MGIETKWKGIPWMWGRGAGYRCQLGPNPFRPAFGLRADRFCRDSRASYTSPPVRTVRRSMKHLKPREAQEFLHTHPDALFVDCRSEMEYLFVGHPLGALHVAWNDGPDWEINPHFVGQVKRLAGTNHTKRSILLICRSGNRSVDAGIALEQAGFTDVYNVLHGFEGDLDDEHHRGSKNGWRFDGLPWEQC
jgi:rhodanese-related sulfurtransferase